MDIDVEVSLVTGVQLRTLREVAARLHEGGLQSEGSTILGVVDAVAQAKRGVPTGDAARALGVTPQTVRNWVQGGVLMGWQDATGHVLVAPGALAPALAMRGALPQVDGPPVSDEDIDAEITAVRAERRGQSATTR